MCVDIYEATGRMLWDLAAEEERYMSNMTLLLAEMKGKWKGDLIETGKFVHHPPPTSLGNSPILTFIQLAPHGPQDGKIGHRVRQSAH